VRPGVAGLMEGGANVIRNGGWRASNDAIHSLVSHKLLGTKEWCCDPQYGLRVMQRLVKQCFDTARGNKNQPACISVACEGGTPPAAQWSVLAVASVRGWRPGGYQAFWLLTGFTDNLPPNPHSSATLRPFQLQRGDR
jgi:hypothetical protein